MLAYCNKQHCHVQNEGGTLGGKRLSAGPTVDPPLLLGRMDQLIRLPD